MPKQNFYDVLGVKPDASADEVKRAYRKLVRETHPDLHPGDKQAEARFKEVQEAYDILGDTEKREKYDRFGSAAFEQGGPGPRTKGYTWSSAGAGGGPQVDVDFGDVEGFEDILGGLFGGRFGGGRGQRAAPEGRDVQAEVNIPFRTAMLGGDLEVNDPTNPSQQLSIRIPGGVNDGARLRLAGKGQKSRAAGKPGDLYVLVHVQPHPYFTRKGNDVIVEVPVSVDEAVLGASVDVPTLDGTITVSVPAGSSSGQKLRLKGKGGAQPNGARGDQYVVVKIVVPKSVDEESRRLIQEFARRNPRSPREGLGW